MSVKKKVAVTLVAVLAVTGFIYVFINRVLNSDNALYSERLDEILADEKEIERKWVIDKDKIPYDLDKEDVRVYEIEQTYICFDPEMRVRRYNGGEFYEYTVKTNMTSDGMVRDEVNIDINETQYNNLVIKKEGNTINKTRYQFYSEGQLIAIDIFHGDLDGLAYMEIEFPTMEESLEYETSDWVIREVTDDINYKNGHLARYGIPENEK
ncbi:MAG: hypothetical protein BWY61_01816 [Firmicutes bacterium ADurb.Bin354]|nr:MAG: hypothetical protein BWY61_01816 [Firmicutes bacterium ADurb.Bin354]